MAGLAGHTPDREEAVPAARGVTLHLEHFSAPGEPRMVAVGLHGYSSHAGLYRHVGTTLAAAGIATTLFDCRGHGQSTGPRGCIRRFGEYVDDLQLVVERARAPHPQLPWVLFGHSHGALVALESVLAGRSVPSRLVLAAPYLALAMKVPAWKLVMAPVLSRLWPTLALANEIRPEDVSRAPAVIEGFAADPLVHHVATARWFSEVLAAQARSVAAAGALRVPTLVLVAGQDRIVDNTATLAFAEAAAAVASTRRYEALFHEVFLEPEWQDVVGDMTAWLCAPAPSPRAPARLGRATGELPAIIQPRP